MLAIVAAICLLVVAVAYFSFRNDLSPQECERLESKKNVAVGYLENGPLAPHRPNKLPEAATLFEELAQARPGDPLAARNLAITRLLQLQTVAEPAMKADVAGRARAAAQALVAADDSSPVSHLLAGKIAALTGDPSRARSELSRAAELNPDDATLWYDLFSFLKASPDETAQEAAPAALVRAYQAAPDNLALQLSWLESEATAKDMNVNQTADALRSSLSHMPGLVANVAALSNGFIADPLAWLEQVKDAAKQADWPRAQRLVRQFVSVTRPDPWTLSDLRRVERHPLEYVLHDFQTACPTRPTEAAPGESSNVKLIELPAAEQLPVLVGVQDLALADFDLDERLDVIVLRDAGVEVYARHNGRGTGWRRIADFSLSGGFERLLAVDLDRDDPQQPGTEAHRQAQQRQHAAAAEQKGGATEEPAATKAPDAPCHRADLDLVVYGTAGIRFLRNTLNDDQARSLDEVPQSAELSEVSQVMAAVAADFYHDGDLDLAVAAADGLHLWSNRGDMTFSEITAGSQLPPRDEQPTALVAIDWDRDIDLDLIVANASGNPAGYLENLRHGQFRWRPFDAGFEALNSAKAVTPFDSAGSGSWNLMAAGQSGSTLLHTAVSPSGVVAAGSSQQVSGQGCDGLVTWDFDNDGYLDLVAWSKQAIEFFRGTESGELAAMPPLFVAALQNIRACRTGDLDGDGDEDLAVAETGRVALYSNEGGNANAWLDVELRAGVVDAQSLSFRSNHYGIGSLIELRSDNRFQRKLVTAGKTHFGLGEQRQADSLRVVWTTGVPQNIVEPAAKVVICDEQVLLGSCPYLYTWSGERFEFYTDCLWSAPLGLLLGEGQAAPSRSWEYLRVEGDKLQPRDRCYPLAITEELWEAVYFDQVRLIAVDHPADVDVYSNEKVGPAEIAEFKVHTVRGPRRPVAARDQRGRDVLDAIHRRDGKYVKAFDRRLAFGYTEDHFVELDFGKLDNPRQVTLFLTGWIFPSGTSMNVAISQNPGLKPAAPPSLWVPDADGQWRQVRPYLGFPGGKTKTIAVDLSDAFLTDDYRLRIATNMEFYWDEAFLTVDEPPAEFRLTPLDLLAANLHYRGFSRRTPGENHGPEKYDYEQVSVGPKWPAMRGHFTRYGDVSELLAARDDMLVVLGAGDELSLRFAVPQTPLPAGWKRDFLLYNVGWDKDCDLNTIYGETVEPLPFGDLTGYPYTAEDSIHDLPRYRNYLRTYQTRTQDPTLFWHRP